MNKADKEVAAKAADVLFRYMRARRRCNEGVEQPLPAHELAALIERGKEEFDEIYVEPHANPPIVLDGKADYFFGAIMKKIYSAMPDCDPQLLAAWRMYVLRDVPSATAAAPRLRRQPRPAARR